jgi:hypothetical protein
MRRTCSIFLALLLSTMLFSMFKNPSVRAEPSTGGWSKTYGGTDDDTAFALVQAVDGGYALAGSTDSFGAGAVDFWLVKTDADGVALWNRTYGGARYDYAAALVQTADSGYALAGCTRSFGAGAVDFWLVKTDADGVAQWNMTYGGAADDTV